MKNKIKTILLIVYIIAVLGIIFYTVDSNRAKNNQKPLFCIKHPGGTILDGGTIIYFGLGYKVIDFHTHPFSETRNNICSHKSFLDMSREETAKIFENFGVSKICGSVIVNAPLDQHESRIDRIISNNNTALELRDYYGDFYVPGFHIHPDYIDESISEMNRMQKNNKYLSPSTVE